MGTLYLVATPIGNLEDLGLRALRVLGEVPVVLAEDTRVSVRLLARHGLRTKLTSYRAANETRMIPRVLAMLEEHDLALVSDAGMPGINDPGLRLVNAARRAGHVVSCIPGPSAVTSAVVLSGFAGPGFIFLGYLPRKPGQLRSQLAAMTDEVRPAVAFESPHRLAKTLAIIGEVLGPRPIAVARELTKVHEEVRIGPAAKLAADYQGVTVKGECTLVLAGCKELGPESE